MKTGRPRDVEERLNEAERVLAVVSILSAAIGRGGDLCIPSEVEDYAWSYVGQITEDAFRDLRAIHRTLPASAHMLPCRDSKEAE